MVFLNNTKLMGFKIAASTPLKLMNLAGNWEVHVIIFYTADCSYICFFLQGHDSSQLILDTFLSQRFVDAYQSQEEQQNLWSAVKYADVIRNPG